MAADDDDELTLIRETARRLTDGRFRARAGHWDRAAEAPLENLPALVEHGLLGVTIDPRWGGVGASVVHAVAAIEEVARGCTATAAFILAACVAAEVLQAFGSEEQKSRYLPGISEGRMIGAWAMTETEAGSAATELRTRATREADGWRLDGTKIFITRAAVATFFIVFARVDQ